MRIACIVGGGYEESELNVPMEGLRQAGHEVVLVGERRGEEVAGKHGVEKVTIDVGIDDARSDDFDALFIPGGHSPDHLRADDRFVDLVEDFDDQGKPIAAVCHGPQLLLTADLVEGRRMTAWETVQVDLSFAGADVVDEPVVVDDNLITSRKPEDLDVFTRELLRVLDTWEGERAGPDQLSPTV